MAVRYAVVGLGHIAQVAVLPAFAHAKKNSEVTALISDDPEKLKKLGRKYGVSERFSYAEFDQACRSGTFDAVYIALPNHLHRAYAVRAADAGIHVLCEKPLAVTEADCEAMIAAAEANSVKLMTAYRLHFDPANLRTIEVVQSGKLGDIKLFNSTFTLQVKEGDIRLNPHEQGGGVLYDIGIYCINAARYLFQAEPEEVFATVTRSGDPRFTNIEESVSAMMHFPENRLASFSASFGAADVSIYRVVGSKGDVALNPAYEYAGAIKQTVTKKSGKRRKSFPKHDQFAPELMAFSKAIEKDTEPEPSGREGLADVRIIRAMYESAERGRPVKLQPFEKDQRPTRRQEVMAPPVKKPELVNAEPSSK